jgi:hypothetical protein
MRLIRLVSLVWVLGVSATACGGTSSGTDAGGGIPLEEVPAKYAAALCQAYQNCVGDLFALFRPGEDCVKNTTVTLEEALATLPNAVDRGTVKYHGDKLQACLDEVTAGDCSLLSNREPASCQAALEGTIKQGADCQLDAECAGAQYCKLGDQCPGQCAPYEKAGSACAGDGNCDSGLKCGPTGLCVAPAKAGKACKQGEPECVDGYVCLGDDTAQKKPGSCIAIATALNGKAGDTCSLDSNLCSVGFSCEIKSLAPIGGDCVTKVAADGECHAAVPDECPDDQYCALSNPLLPGKCTPKPAPGEKCAAGLGDTLLCQSYARCDDGVCREIAHAGEKCTNNDTCYSGHCVNGGCVTDSSCE